MLENYVVPAKPLDSKNKANLISIKRPHISPLFDLFLPQNLGKKTEKEMQVVK